MAGAAEILREYFVSLGFKVNKQDTKNFENTMVGIGVKANLVSDAIEGVAKAAISMAQHYADSMQDLYRTSRSLGDSAENVAAFGFAGKQAGADWMAAAKQMRQSLTQMQFVAYQSKLLGRTVSENDSPTKDALDVVKAIRAKGGPMWFKQQEYELAGGSGSYRDLENTVDEVNETSEKAAAKAKALGLNLTEMSKAGDAWNHELGETWNDVELFKGALIQKMLPSLREAGNAAKLIRDQIVQDVIKADGFWSTMGAASQFWTKSLGPLLSGNLSSQAVGAKGPGEMLSGAGSSIKNWLLSFSNGGKGVGGGGAAAPAPASAASAPASSQEKEAFLAGLERKYGLPDGVLDGIWAQESKRGTDPNAFNGAGLGHSVGDFQITRKTGDSYGGYSDKFEVQADQAARIMVDAIKRNRTIEGALTEYNAGPTVAANPALGTDSQRAYASQVLHKIEQHNTINVDGGNPGAIIPAVSSALQTSNGNLLRDFKTVVR